MKHSPDDATAHVGGFGPRDTDPAKQARDPVTGQYAFDNRFDRLCVCGHRLGDHIAGGFDCDVPLDHGMERAAPCDCIRFRASRAKNPYRAPLVPASSAGAAPPRTPLPLTSGVSAAREPGDENR